MIGKGVLFLLLGSCLLAGCGSKAGDGEEGDLVVTVNNYTITREEFENEFRASSYGKVDTPESRRDFLNTLIDRKLILQYAQKEGLDKEKSFLKAIEKFWEQSLLKIALERKTKQIESKSQADSSNWEDKIGLEAKMMNDWMDAMRKNARVAIRDSALESKIGNKEGT